jgi:type II secretory pathway pseudopilin PulG
MKNSGFSLVEFLIYTVLFSFLAVLFFGVASRAQFKFITTTSAQENLLRQVLAIDLLRRDLMSASFVSSDWDVQQNAVFKKMTLTSKNRPQSVCVCWFIAARGLMRAQGEYDFTKHEWINRTSCIVCQSINSIKFILQKSLIKEFRAEEEFLDERKDCVGVWVIYKDAGSGQEKRFFVKFRNRVVEVEA